MDIMTYINPELLALVPVLLVCGKILKSTKLDNKWIPFTLTLISLVLNVGYNLTVGTEPLSKLLYNSFMQGVLCAGLAVYGHEVYNTFKTK